MKYLAINAAVLVILTLPSCGNKTASPASVGPISTSEISWADSINVDNCSARCEISVMYPDEGNEALLDSTRGWIAQALSSAMPVDTAAVAASFPQEVLSDGNRLIADVGKRVLDYARGDFESFGKEDAFSINYEYNAAIGQTFSTDSVVTFTSSIYIYTGGAHGATLANGASFRSTDGRQLGYGIFETASLPELAQMVKAAISDQYFEAGDEFKMEDALIIDPQEFPLPAVAPYFTSKGLTFIYQQYEIACYAAGMPTCTLSYHDVAPLMTPDARRLIP